MRQPSRPRRTVSAEGTIRINCRAGLIVAPVMCDAVGSAVRCALGKEESAVVASMTAAVAPWTP